MLQALSTPVFKSILIGGVLLGLGALRSTDHPITHRLALQAIEEPRAIYLSAWRDGDVNVAFEGKELRPITFYVRASLNDGCRWMATETLVPIDAKHFAYDYSETILECDPDAVPLIKTPRTGLVTVVDSE